MRFFFDNRSFTFVGVTYSATRQRNNCFTFQSNNGFKSKPIIVHQCEEKSSNTHSYLNSVVKHLNHFSFDWPKSPSYVFYTIEIFIISFEKKFPVTYTIGLFTSMSTFPSYRCENVERNTPIVNTASTDNVKAKSVFNRLRNECIIDLEIELLGFFFSI